MKRGKEGEQLLRLIRKREVAVVVKTEGRSVVAVANQLPLLNFLILATTRALATKTGAIGMSRFFCLPYCGL
jgi:hypothetical protein